MAVGGAGAGSQSPFALPRAETLYISGKQWGPYTNFNPLRPDYNTGTVGLLYETLFRYDPLKDKFIPWLATNGKWVGKSYVVTLRKGVDVERRQAAHGRRREVHVRDRKAARVPVRDDVEDRPDEHHARRATSSRSTSRGRRTTRSGTSTCTRSRSCRGTSGRSTARRRSRPGNTADTQEAGRHRPVQVRRGRGRHRRRSSGTGATAGGRRRRSA